LRRYLLAACIAFCGFAAPVSAVEVEVHDDSFNTWIEYSIPSYRDDSEDFGDTRSWVVTATKDRATGVVGVQLTFFGGYSSETGWRNYNAARLEGGKVLEVSTGDRDVIGCQQIISCRFFESLSISIPNDVVRAAATQGLTVKVFAGESAVDYIVIVPAADIKNLATALGL
jgi:hypothetical protein